MNRALLLRVHRYIGLALAPFLLIQAATGALLLWRDDVARLFDPAATTSRRAGTTISAGEAVLRAEQALPQGRVARLQWPATPDGTFLARLTTPGGTLYAAIDPAGGAVLRSGGVASFPAELALALHLRLLTGRAGMAVVVLDGLALLALAASGIMFWWPKRAPRWRQLTVRWNVAGRLVLRQLHRTIGVTLSAVLAFSALTGVLLAVPELAAGSPTAPVRPPVSPAVIDRAVAAAHRLAPMGALHDLRIDAARIVVNITAPERGPRAMHRVTVPLSAPGTPVLLRAGDNPALWMTILPLHAGDPLGTAGRLLLLLGAMILAALAISGPLMWWQVAAVRRRAMAAKTQAATQRRPA